VKRLVYNDGKEAALIDRTEQSLQALENRRER